MSRRIFSSLIGAALVLALGSPSAFADKNDKGKGKSKKHGNMAATADTANTAPHRGGVRRESRRWRIVLASR